MFGASPPPQNELTPFYPRSRMAPPGLFVLGDPQLSREAYGLFAVNGILFNHSHRGAVRLFGRRRSPGPWHLSRPLSVRGLYGQSGCGPRLGVRPNTSKGMWRMLQTGRPDDFVLATGRGFTVREFARGRVRACRLDAGSST